MAGLTQKWGPAPPGLFGDGFTAELEWALRHGGLRLLIRERRDLHAWIAAGRVTWWAHAKFAVVAEPPADLHLERLPGGGYRLHRADGPALAWKDGVSFGYWHGRPVPLDLVMDGWSVDRIHEEHNKQ
jgi:hypothetical protein